MVDAELDAIERNHPNTYPVNVLIAEVRRLQTEIERVKVAGAREILNQELEISRLRVHSPSHCGKCGNACPYCAETLAQRKRRMNEAMQQVGEVIIYRREGD